MGERGRRKGEDWVSRLAWICTVQIRKPGLPRLRLKLGTRMNLMA